MSPPPTAQMPARGLRFSRFYLDPENENHGRGLRRHDERDTKLHCLVRPPRRGLVATSRSMTSSRAQRIQRLIIEVRWPSAPSADPRRRPRPMSGIEIKNLYKENARRHLGCASVATSLVRGSDESDDPATAECHRPQATRRSPEVERQPFAQHHRVRHVPGIKRSLRRPIYSRSHSLCKHGHP